LSPKTKGRGIKKKEKKKKKKKKKPKKKKSEKRKGREAVQEVGENSIGEKASEGGESQVNLD